MANNLGKDLGKTAGKLERYKLGIGIAVLVGLFAVAADLTNFLKTSEENGSKVEVIKRDSDQLIEYGNTFEYEPNYSHFFAVEDELEELKANEKRIVSKGEIDIRKVLGSKMDRAHPKLIQAKAKPIDYKTIASDSNSHKGQIISVLGKVIKIRTLRKIPQILSKQFVHSVFVEDAQGGVFDCRSIRLPFDLSEGDVISMSGVYLKMRVEKLVKVPVAIVLGNSIQTILPKPFFWEDVNLFKIRNALTKSASEKLIKFPKEDTFKKWTDEYSTLIDNNEKLWVKIKDDTADELKTLSTDFEKVLIENLSYTNKNILLGSAKLNKSYADVVKNKNNYRRKINKIVGTLTYIDIIPLEGKLGKASKVYYSKIKDLNGNEYLFNFINHTFIDHMDRIALGNKSRLIPQVGDIVVCSGVFVKLMQDKDKKVPLIYGKRMSVIGNYEEIWDSIDHVKAGVGIHMTVEKRMLSGTIDKRPYAYLLNKLSYMTPADVLTKYNKLAGDDITSWTKFMTKPKMSVDKPYFKYGRVKLIREIDGLNYYDYHGVDKIYEMYIVDKESHLITLYSLNKPKGLVVNSKVYFNGYFFKKFTYSNIGNQLQWNPLIVGYIHSIETREIKTMSKFDIIMLIIVSLGIVFFMVFVSKQHDSFKRRINHLRDNQFKREKLSREEIKSLNKKGKDLTTSLLINMHFSFLEEAKIPIELCQNVDHWNGNIEEANGQWRPEFLNSYVKSVVDHYKQYDTELPKDLKFALINKRKEMLGLRAYQKSKLELSEEEKKRVGSIMITPISRIKNEPESLDRLDGYFDEYGLPPWNTWISFSALPKNVIKNPNSGYKPQTQVILSWVPVWMEEKLKNVIPTLKNPPRREKTKGNEGGNADS